VEDGGKGSEFNEFPAKGTNLMIQARWAAGGIVANYERYNTFLTTGEYVGSRRATDVTQFRRPPTFIEFMARYGGPTGYGRSPIDIPGQRKSHVDANKDWVKDMGRKVEEITKHFDKRTITRDNS